VALYRLCSLQVSAPPPPPNQFRKISLHSPIHSDDPRQNVRTRLGALTVTAYRSILKSQPALTCRRDDIDPTAWPETLIGIGTQIMRLEFTGGIEGQAIQICRPCAPLSCPETFSASASHSLHIHSKGLASTRLQSHLSSPPSPS
jgi:hypothetical protein